MQDNHGNYVMILSVVVEVCCCSRRRMCVYVYLCDSVCFFLLNVER